MVAAQLQLAMPKRTEVLSIKCIDSATAGQFLHSELHFVRLLTRIFVLAICVTSTRAVSAWAQSFLVRNGQPTAEIVITEDAPRSTRLAAQELQRYVEKVLGNQAAPKTIREAAEQAIKKAKQ